LALAGSQALIRADSLSAVALSGFGLKTEVRELKAKVLGAGNLNIEALSSVELSDVEVQDGSISVTSIGNILAKNVRISTDRYSNQLSLSAASVPSIDQVVAGQTIALSLEAGAEIKNVEKELIVVPSVVDDVIYEGDSAEFRVDPDGYGGPALVLEGDEPGSWPGRSIAVGDVNGDSFDDVMRVEIYLGALTHAFCCHLCVGKNN